jgi:Tfp pilus assembly protein PilF
MDRKEGAAGFPSLISIVSRMCPGPLVAILVLGLAFQPGCSSRSSAARHSYQQVRPISNVSRVVQNASYYRRIGRTELAVDELEQARLQEPDNLQLLDVLIQSYEELGDFDRAQELYEEALSKRGGHQPALENNRCYSLYLQGRLDQSETCFRQALARQPDNQQIRNNLGLVLCRQGREAEALAMWREALRDGEARQRMGQALTALGKEVPPSLAGSATAPAAVQIVAAGSPVAPLANADVTSRATPALSAPAPVPQPVAQSQSVPPLSPVSQKSGGAAKTTEQLAGKPAPHAAGVAPGGPAQSSSSPAQVATEVASPKPEPAPPQTTTVPATAVSQAGKAPTVARVATSAVRKPQTPVLTALDLEGTWIEVKNGNGAHNQAWEAGNRLFHEGFTIVGIGNNDDFGLEETVIAYRPEAARVAKALAQKYFPGAKLEEGGKLSQEADIRVSLGRDRLASQNLAGQHQELPPALASAPSLAAGRVTTTPSGKDSKAKAGWLATLSSGTP